MSNEFLPGIQDSHIYLQIEYRHPIQTKGGWTPLSQEAPGISKEGAKADDVHIWKLYTEYLNAARESEYRLTRVTRSISKEIL